ncbi:GntR family transcriptional regulator [Halanaerobium saccharolyticum]|uniref:GntR family transcriptional regulator n=1 Tax=Halanaerobium saccharolyticum TaxID=43595 RepID=A0A4V3G5Y4_9FIRM|nr:GntR family transcriptional regulator [Halanaerobium saccharolyticum]RAK08643.1 GntR family transcriptional regulator [Halanaerobium saccharolyticum]TDW07214.1 GntR family transcriptional regulator [Halanaerobium saccharolyticum]TDX60195.1 GntR family transcriptional regulator [Halanaerobium saccharolyticum]
MDIDFNAAYPIYEQVIDEIKKEIVRGELNSGDKLPSQRKLARKIEVNPNTVQRAYREMEQRGLVETKRGRGTFIKDDDQVMVEIKKEMAETAVLNFIEEMISLGFEKENILKKVESNLKRREDNE